MQVESPDELYILVQSPCLLADFGVEMVGVPLPNLLGCPVLEVLLYLVPVAAIIVELRPQQLVLLMSPHVPFGELFRHILPDPGDNLVH